jgi:hypothetical protein
MSIEQAKTFIELALRGGPAPAAEVIAGAEKLGISERTLKRAKSELEVQSVKQGKVWMWKQEGQTTEQGGQMTNQEGHGVPEDAASRILARKKRISEGTGLRAFSAQDGGIITHDEVLRRKGYVDGGDGGPYGG